MENIEGRDINNYLYELGPPKEIERIKKIAFQILSGLNYMHENSMVH
jgi:serine/threonine protein kinase